MSRQLLQEGGISGRMRRLVNIMFAYLYQTPQFGLYLYIDATTLATPLVIAAADTWYDITNDADTENNTYALPGVADIWDEAANRFDFSDLSLGDSIEISAGFAVTTAGANQTVDMQVVLGEGTASETAIPIITSAHYKTAAEYNIEVQACLCMISTDFKDHPAKLQIRSDGTGSVKVGALRVRVLKRQHEAT